VDDFGLRAIVKGVTGSPFNVNVRDALTPDDTAKVARGGLRVVPNCRVTAIQLIVVSSPRQPIRFSAVTRTEAVCLGVAQPARPKFAIT
jgi:hypothetical protein